MKWIKLKRYCEESGDTPDAVQKKLARGIWVEGLHIRTAEDGVRWVNTEVVDLWVELGTVGVQQMLKDKTASASANSDRGRASKSTSAIEASAAANA